MTWLLLLFHQLTNIVQLQISSNLHISCKSCKKPLVNIWSMTFFWRLISCCRNLTSTIWTWLSFCWAYSWKHMVGLCNLKPICIILFTWIVKCFHLVLEFWLNYFDDCTEQFWLILLLILYNPYKKWNMKEQVFLKQYNN